MAGSIAFNLSPAVLEWARSSMGYSIEEAAKKAGVPAHRYEAWETGKKQPTYKQLEGLAENVYKRPIAVLLLENPPSEEPIEKEFRSLSNAQISDLPSSVRLALRKARRFQLILEEVVFWTTPPKYTSFRLTITEDAGDAAARFREFIDFKLAEQEAWRPEDSYRHFQALIETIGIYVFKLKLPMPQVRAFCLTGRYPVIVLNTDDSQNGRIFSLFHETCHILLNENDLFNDRQGEASRGQYARIENFCNEFSASFLVPDDSFQADLQFYGLRKNEIGDNQIQRLARRYNVSNEVIARKLLLRKLITEDFFWARKLLWDAAARSAKEKQNESLKDSDSGINQGIKVIFEKGKPYVSSVINAFHQGLISSADLTDYLETKLSNLAKINDRLNS
jgi:Zn-dependent peptidase ImmA (M78 family)